MAISYELINGEGDKSVVTNLTAARTLIEELQALLNEETLVSDVGVLSNLYSSKLSSLYTELGTILENIPSNVSSAKSVEGSILDGTY